MIFVLSFVVFGASGVQRPFPNVSTILFGWGCWTLICFLQWWGNPLAGNIDYCNGNGALDS